ncbi:unnamed protein product, partial [Urochloa humidicola]
STVPDCQSSPIRRFSYPVSVCDLPQLSVPKLLRSATSTSTGPSNPRPSMAAAALLLPSFSAAAPTDKQRCHHLLPYLQLQRSSLASGALRPPLPRRRLAVRAVQETKEEEAKTAEEITEKYGLEFGLWKVFSSKEESAAEGGEGKRKSRTEQAKELLAKYGGAYLATSISLSLVSFTLCYLLISAGVDVQDLLARVPTLYVHPMLAPGA